MSRYRGERRVLDVGYANAPAAYLALLLGLGVQELHCVDLARRPLLGAAASRADVRRLPYADRAFALALCVSTLEHVGLNNTRYAPLAEADPGDVEALAELARVLVPGGRLLVTVPIGQRENHGWFHQYDQAEWARAGAPGPVRDGGGGGVPPEPARVGARARPRHGCRSALRERGAGCPGRVVLLASASSGLNPSRNVCSKHAGVRARARGRLR